MTRLDWCTARTRGRRLSWVRALQFDIVVDAPDVLTEPDRRTRLYTRVAKAAANEITFCVDYDRSIEPGCGKQRFDLTPPADMPPPPSRPR